MRIIMRIYIYTYGTSLKGFRLQEAFRTKGLGSVMWRVSGCEPKRFVLLMQG